MSRISNCQTVFSSSSVSSRGPQGETGPQGPQGIQGPTGPAGSGGSGENIFWEVEVGTVEYPTLKSAFDAGYSRVLVKGNTIETQAITSLKPLIIYLDYNVNVSIISFNCPSIQIIGASNPLNTVTPPSSPSIVTMIGGSGSRPFSCHFGVILKNIQMISPPNFSRRFNALYSSSRFKMENVRVIVNSETFLCFLRYSIIEACTFELNASTPFLIFNECDIRNLTLINTFVNINNPVITEINQCRISNLVHRGNGRISFKGIETNLLQINSFTAIRETSGTIEWSLENFIRLSNGTFSENCILNVNGSKNYLENIKCNMNLTINGELNNFTDIECKDLEQNGFKNKFKNIKSQSTSFNGSESKCENIECGNLTINGSYTSFRSVICNNLNISGSDINLEIMTCNILTLVNSNNVSFENCKFYEITGTDITNIFDTPYACDQIKFSKCLFAPSLSNGGEPTHTYFVRLVGTNFSFHNCRFDRTITGSVIMDYSRSQYTSFHNCLFNGDVSEFDTNGLYATFIGNIFNSDININFQLHLPEERPLFIGNRSKSTIRNYANISSSSTGNIFTGNLIQNTPFLF